MMPENSYIYIFSNTEQLRNGDVDYQFRQNSNFWYFTGINQAGCLFVLIKDGIGNVSEILLIELENPFVELWHGAKLSSDQAMEIAGINKVIATCENHNEYMLKLVEGKENVDCFGREKHGTNSIRELRLIKSEWEIGQMRKAAQISLRAHQFAFQNLRRKMDNGEKVFENQFQADLEYIWIQNGCSWAYYPIVAGGNRGSKYLHYDKNDGLLNPGELLLVDAACEYGYYASDITRTYPVSGTFSEPQKQIYNIVQQAQQICIEYLNKGGRSKKEFHNVAVQFLTQKLLALGILNGDLKGQLNEYDVLRKSRSFDININNIYTFFPHGIGHFLGLDVHDVGQGIDELKPGMCLTVEPGLYFHPDCQSVPKEYRGIGIRIEDDVVIREIGVEVITE